MVTRRELLKQAVGVVAGMLGVGVAGAAAGEAMGATMPASGPVYLIGKDYFKDDKVAIYRCSDWDFIE
jgi:hypothetical protein